MELDSSFPYAQIIELRKSFLLVPMKCDYDSKWLSYVACMLEKDVLRKQQSKLEE